MRHKGITRRSFLASSAAATAGLALAPRIGAQSANDKLNIAAIGAGGQGMSNLDNCRSENIVALCDVDEERAAQAFAEWPDAARFTDYRQMLDEMGNEIDAVIVATPDHTHANPALACMQAGKHVYVEKPLTHSIEEARILTEAARYHNVATQMGNQGNAGDGVRQVCEMIWGGHIGQVHTAHIWSDRPIWPQGMEAPEKEMEVPDTLDWDLWLGPRSYRPYHESYLPFDWRGWWDFGCGALGDMACHNMNPSYKALHLGFPDEVELVRQEGMTDAAAPNSSVIRYHFPARRGMDPVEVFWYDGGELPPRPEGVPEDEELGQGEQGSLLIGEDGILTFGTHAENVRLLPAAEMEDFELPEPRIPSSPGHRLEWIQAAKGGPRALSNFDYSGPFTEMVLLGNVAIRAGERLEWDAENMRVTNNEAANQYVRNEYREGWELQ
ncbi:MAG: Gfo/Idh/MocA family protein [Candidatus Hydrogenedentota bacterium]